MPRRRPCIGHRGPCPARALTTNSTGRCDTCRSKRDKARGSREDRGYGHQHRALRTAIQKRMDAGEVFICWRDGKPINPGEPWDLGHDDNDRTKYMGPEHQACNRATARPGAGPHRDRT